MLFVWIVDFADGGHGTEKKRLSTLFVHDPRPNCMTKREVLLVDVSTQCTKIINACVEEMDLKLLPMIRFDKLSTIGRPGYVMCNG